MTSSSPSKTSLRNFDSKGEAMTERQESILRFILEVVLNEGYQPSYREIMDRFDIKSPNGVACHIRALKKKGYLGESRGSRAIDLTEALKWKALLKGKQRR